MQKRGRGPLPVKNARTRFLLFNGNAPQGLYTVRPWSWEGNNTNQNILKLLSRVTLLT